MEPFDPIDPLKLKDEIVAKGATMYYAEQADLNAEALVAEIRRNAAEAEQVRKQADKKIDEFKARFSLRRLPVTLAKKGYQIINTKSRGRLGRLRHGDLRAFFSGRSLNIPTFSDISFAYQPKPSVSVVIPVYNLLDITLDCLRSLANCKESVPFEVIVVDDKSPDPLVAAVLRRIPGIVFEHHQVNQGFVGSCNTGASKARGEIIYFLNNDTKVEDNFLSPVVELYADARVGAVGSKLVHPTGLLQEAGGVIFNTGEAWNYGKTDLVDRPEYNMVRDVDYCSGAGLSIRTELFSRIGGFNMELSPGYYEDVELCFAVRQLGYRVLYQPRSIVVHYEGASSSMNAVEEGKKPMKAYQEVNFHKFKKMRATELATQWPKMLPYLPTIARRKRGFRIWVFDWIVPMADRDYGSARMLSILKILSKDHTVTFIPRTPLDRPRYREILQRMGIEVFPGGIGANLTNKMRADGKFIDLIIMSRPDVLHFFYHLVKRFAPQAPIIYDTVDVHHQRLEREIATVEDEKKKLEVQHLSGQYKALEKEYGSRSDAIWAISPNDQEAFRRLVPAGQIDIVSGAHPVLSSVAPLAGRKDMFYIGSFYHTPNRDAIEYYVTSILPLLKQRLPDVKLHVIGEPVPEDLRRMVTEKAGDSVEFVGAIDDAALLDYHQRARLFVCPLRFGSGLKGKVLMALANGLPVVTTSIGAEGIPFSGSQDVAIADTPQDFVNAIEAIYKDDTLWVQRSQNGQRIVADHFSEQNMSNEIMASLIKLEERLGRFDRDRDTIPPSNRKDS